ncbi:MAG: DUF3443 family protein, partial [Proteobacteria bacterium]|nr:DUF3443 family protein [Pseudomonadota bacterium]
KTARVRLGNEPAVTVPIQVVDSTFTGMNAHCKGAMATPEEGGFNAILGLGLFQHDCGLNCAISALNGNYYACDSGTGTCSGAAVSLAHQVQNPVSLLPTDHNGVILQLPDLAATGATSAEGYLILGIGTRSNNVPDPAVHAFKANSSYGEFITRFEGQDDPSFIDSGSNSFAFPNGGANLAICSYPYSGWFCPAGLSDLSATTISADQSISGAVPFQIGSFLSFANSANFASKTIGAAASSGISGFFDWGLPFYFGKNVYHGIEGQSSSLGQGPYWAY